MRHALTAGPAVDRWDWGRIIEFIKWFCMSLDIPKLAGSNGLRDLDRKYRLKLCGMMVQSSVQTPGSGPEIASYPRLESHDGTSNSGDRQMGRYEVSRTETTCSEYCPYIKGISVNDWAVSNRPAVEAIVFRSPDRLVWDTRDKDTTWIRLN